ncbi:MAG: hypothetical protein KUG74_07465 [Rhodobacteraceae bacterium]|nr:hypothetical protein [Paracoccaceae bacterium]
MPRNKVLAGMLAVLCAGPALAENYSVPAIWPSNVLTPDSIRQSSKRPVLGGAHGLATEVITVTSLDDVTLDSVGVLPADIVGVPSDFWGDSPAPQLVKLLRHHKENALPDVTALLHHILLAELTAPVGQSDDGVMLLARLDHLLSAGALDQAEALLERSGTPNAALFRRWFDVSLLTGRAERACSAMLADAGLTPSLQARVFCLFRAGDWAAAALTLRGAASLGEIDADDALLLGMFLDPEFYAGEADPPHPEHLTPLLFTMREALALPRNGQTLPLAFLQGDLQNYSGWRNRLEAAERLVRSQAIPATTLIEAYNEAQASASGGIWDRVRGVQALRAALAAHDSAAVSAALPLAYHTLSKAQLEYVLADMVFPRISDLDLDETAAGVRFKLALLHKDRATLAAGFAGSNATDTFLLALAQMDMAHAIANSEMQKAILAAFQGSTMHNQLLLEVTNGRKGAAVLQALNILEGDRLSDPVAVETALAVLVQTGLASEAVGIAIQLLILNRQDLI